MPIAGWSRLAIRNADGTSSSFAFNNALEAGSDSGCLCLADDVEWVQPEWVYVDHPGDVR
jgi:hypothetical protein